MGSKKSPEESNDAKLDEGRSETGCSPERLHDGRDIEDYHSESGRRFLNCVSGLQPFDPSEEQMLGFLRAKKENLSGKYSSVDSMIATFVDAYSLEPTQLREKSAPKGDEKMLFFTPRITNDGFAEEETFPNDATFPAGSGYWKVVKCAKGIINSQGRLMIGVKTVLAYFSAGGQITNWVIDEYTLPEDFYFPAVSENQHDYWVLCEVYQRKNGVLDREKLRIN